MYINISLTYSHLLALSMILVYTNLADADDLGSISPSHMWIADKQMKFIYTAWVVFVPRGSHKLTQQFSS